MRNPNLYSTSIIYIVLTTYGQKQWSQLTTKGRFIEFYQNSHDIHIIRTASTRGFQICKVTNLTEIFKSNHERHFYRIRQERALERAEVYFAANRAAAQLGKRTRRAPARLNITSTKKKSYL